MKVTIAQESLGCYNGSKTHKSVAENYLHKLYCSDVSKLDMVDCTEVYGRTNYRPGCRLFIIWIIWGMSIRDPQRVTTDM